MWTVVQELTDSYVKKIDELVAKKNKELTTV
jgi:ribosome recycling factor